VRPEGSDKSIKFNHLVGFTRDLPACNRVPQLLRYGVPQIIIIIIIIIGSSGNADLYSGGGAIRISAGKDYLDGDLSSFPTAQSKFLPWT
jgi:hypothetical protein